MPAMLEDPASPAIFRRSGEQPYPVLGTPLPANIEPRSLVLRDRTTKASLIPFSAPDQVPLSLLDYLRAQLNREIEKGDTYPMMDEFALEHFGAYWFQNFGAVMLLGDVKSQADVRRMEEEGCSWEKQCLGSFYIKPNYPGRSSHVCNGGFIVTDGARNRGVGRLMGECYLEWAPLLGYTYSVFNLVYETNVVSCRIWDALGFKRIGRVPGCGNLKTQPEGQFVDAIIYGRHLGFKKEDTDDEKRFERIKYYLKTGKYPGDADSAEKNRLRAAVRNYTLVEGDGGGGDGTNCGDKLMLGDKEVISEPRMQYKVARQHHRANKETHAGINKTTATVSEKYHWNRIKTTVTEVIENCAECNEKLKKKSQKSAAAAASNNGRKVSGPDKPTPLSLPSSQEPPSAFSPAPTPGSEFAFQRDFTVEESTSTVATQRASSSVSDMQCDGADAHNDHSMAMDPHNMAMLSSAVQNIGNSAGGAPSMHHNHHRHQQSPSAHHPFGDSYRAVHDPFQHHIHSEDLATSMNPATLHHSAAPPHHAVTQHPHHLHHQQYLSPYQPLADADHFSSQLGSSHTSATGYIDHNDAFLDGCSSDTQRQQFSTA